MTPGSATTMVFRNYRSKFPCAAASKMHGAEVDDLPSTAASSAMHSPSGGPEDAPHGVDALDEHLLGHALSDLYDIAEVAEQDMGEQVRRSKLQQACEWYLSTGNLSRDRFLRSRMDDQGWVALTDLVDFAALRALEARAGEVAAALVSSTVVEISGDRSRVRPADIAVRAAFSWEPAVAAWECDAEWDEVEPEVADEDLTVAATLRPPSLDEFTVRRRRRRDAFEPEVDVADEDLTIATSIDGPSPMPRASKEGAPWPCVEWLTAEPCVDEPLLDWLLSEDHSQTSRRQRRRRRHTAPLRRRRRATEGAVGDFRACFDSEVLPAPDDAPSDAAWLRFEDGAYPSAAGSLLRW
mmetsp:Transcript_16448/g.47640  ORF Transcript_16448/g.47640 Transcript_16448/m.47640 type:complete len:353 (-) Transcript_16448:74-1132(-)